MKFLFVVPPLTGHVNPTVSVGQVLAKRGHDVAWVGHPKKVRPLLARGARLFELDDRIPTGLFESVTDKANEVRGLASLKFLWEDFLVPLAKRMLPQVDEVTARFSPDVLIVDQQAVAGAMVARRRHLPWATFATTSAGVSNPLDALPKVKAWLDSQLASLERDAELEPTTEPDRSPYLVVVFSTTALIGAGDHPDHYLFVGPSISARAETTAFPWNDLLDTKRVLVSLGTVNLERGERFYRIAIEALEHAPLQVVLVAPAALVPSVPDNFIRRDYVPQLDLLAKMDAVVSHGGHNTVCETLAHGLPLVVAPIKDDQPVVAEQVVAAGAGVRVKFGRVTATKLREAVDRVLEEPSFAAAARVIQRSFAAAGGAARAADALESLA